jgi:hypothetical protein
MYSTFALFSVTIHPGNYCDPKSRLVIIIMTTAFPTIISTGILLKSFYLNHFTGIFSIIHFRETKPK